MTIDEAIKILTTQDHKWPHHLNPELGDAHRLGLEALKAVSLCRLGIPSDVSNLLLGETKD